LDEEKLKSFMPLWFSRMILAQLFMYGLLRMVVNGTAKPKYLPKKECNK
jgi:hypothetical protein